MGWAATELVTALKRQVLALETDLRARVDGDDEHARQKDVLDAWRRYYDAAFAAQRTAASWQEWRNDRVTQAAVAWVLLTVFARYCEDNALLSPRWIGGADADHRAQALDARRAYFQQHPEHTDREWLSQIIGHFGKFTATAGLVDRFSPLHLVAPSGDAARALLEFWWQQDGDGQPLYGFAGVDTRFLGDAYQDLSEHAKKTYALLQTPEFVEEFILDQTMEPALADRPLQGFTVIDPTCGSGHFLLGAFARLHQRWQREAPALGARELVAKALDGIYGVDINPFAVAIARFRLLVAALHAAGDSSIEQNIGYTPHLAAGDSLLWGANQQLLPEDLLAGPAIRADATEDADALRSILQREHDVVVGNPPYITPKDAALNATYRKLYSTTHRQYALTVPFMELLFRLAHGSAGTRPAGWIGQITSNSFLKREFGSKLIEEFLPTVDLREVIDTSGAYIPGHGTPTVIIVGRKQRPSSDTVRAVLSVRGEPGRPDNPAKGLVWSTIVDHIDEPGFEDAYINVSDLPRQTFSSHPWSLSGGGAVQLQQQVDKQTAKLGERILVVGRTTHTGSDDAFYLPDAASERLRLTNDVVPVVLGEGVRDYTVVPHLDTVFPYDSDGVPSSLSDSALRYLWPNRSVLSQRIDFQQTLEERGLRWIDHSMFFPQRFRSPLSIAFPFVSTHNHFALDRGGKVFKQTAPAIKLPAGASVEDHLRLLGVLNSSVACFWLKQNSHNKGEGGGARVEAGYAARGEAWRESYEFTGTTLKDFPLPANTPMERAKLLDGLAHELQERSPAELAKRETPTAATLEDSRAELDRLRALMIANQEELDWEYYRTYGLIEVDLTYTGEVPGVALGERAFEIALARRMKDGVETTWFVHPLQISSPITEIPDHLPTAYRDLLQRRLDAIETNPHIRLLEKPEYKRRWASEPWDKQVESALRDWLLDRVEDRALWFDRDGRPTPQSVAQLADVLDRDADFRSVLRLWVGDPNATTGASLAKLLADEAVPFLAAYRYKPSGLDKRAAWEDTWALQRREDAGEKLGSPIPVPPKYKPADFVKVSYWSHRGKLDVPKERFISYPAAGRDTDATELLGWAGWDHAQQALALASLISARIDEGWDTARLVPLLAGLNELAPWVRQWHNEIDPEYGESVADTIDAELTSRLNEHHLTVTDLTSWRPVQSARRGRRAART
ncbi:BREX-2 system adenine-specific DNA-methyltransferase PglX [Mycolicibacterium sp. PAM1]|uniref:site-specific DNA-methyltransferase (adenine-specific) n=1 Tax=Mycolicibacterium gilvum (strain PYR-GCK) TaxID=350054 RepID=A4TAT1_MYCGI|nr:BREX-2 system adenine-specific DNA-methyltransferase PglX [Mycolicibacterium sp. PAM1]ABP45680.1 DNA methylase [Mycolicibacterium gilvum PYR-GCK]MBV5246748.1 BREX-2 system adenine-specific DNA-methyltransferase PglX [Mycolicibacterium sp. PAM1]